MIGDHPREYGENPFEWSDWQFWCGSSPRIRGELRVGRPWQLTWGIIPANTGRMLWNGGECPCLRDHPREYGENPDGSLTSPPGPGSSPRIRGECVEVRHEVFGLGIIPANTGRIGLPPLAWGIPWDHPREYGENRLGFCHCPAKRGIIPANTGRMQPWPFHAMIPRDHPREYGENAKKR